MKRALVDLRRRVLRRWICWWMRRHLDVGKLELTRLGGAAAGWTLPTCKILPGTTAVCVGAGEDIAFDVELNKKGISVFTIDPTPRAKAHVGLVLAAAATGSSAPINNSQADFYELRGFDRGRFTFLDIGLWNENTSKRFFAPRDPTCVSHSIVNLQRTTNWFEAKCMTLHTICEAMSIKNIQILKLDVEGAEYAVLKNIVDTGLLPEVLCVEFDEAANPLNLRARKRIAEVIGLLKGTGYVFLHCENGNALFVREDHSQPALSPSAATMHTEQGLAGAKQTSFLL
jgi:FkbM family methyltransferase